ncbi:MAG: protein-glutamate O-methyltransferase CheR [Leptothrix sp. (in: b-proteobacteria)]
MISQQAFEAVTAMFQRVSGIHLSEGKRGLVSGRLQKLAQARGLRDIDQYVAELMRQRDPAELVRVVDMLTTNETYFFREPVHFELLAGVVAQPRGSEPFRVWSAASSSGEEAYSIAMVLADQFGLAGAVTPWEVLGTDLSTAMVQQARTALYTQERARGVSAEHLRRYCRKGLRDYAGTVLMSRELRERVHFDTANLTEALPALGAFDVIFLRNVLIYFDPPGKTAIVRRVIEHLKPGALLFTGHAESLNHLDLPLRALRPAVYACN